MSSGDQVRDIYHSSQVVQKLLASIMDLKHESVKDRVFVENICTGEPIIWRNFAETVWHEYAATGSLVFGSKMNQITDVPYIVGLPKRMEYH